MTRTEAVKMIMAKIEYIGLPKAIEIYNYLGCYGEIEVTGEIIARYAERR